MGIVSRETTLDPAPRSSTEVSRETMPEVEGIESGTSGVQDVEEMTSTDLPYLDSPIAREAATAVHVQNIRQEQWPKPSSVRVLTVANQKGGVGKTTSTVNVATALAMHGLRVLVVDLDPQGNASTALGVDHSVGTASIYDVLLGDMSLADVVTEVAETPGLFSVPATIDLAGAELELASQVAREYRLQRALTAYLNEQPEIDYIFIDCPPSLGLLTLNALVAAREVMIPIQCEYYALEGLAQLLATVEMVQSYLNPAVAVTTVLLTMYDSRTKLADQVADEVRRHFGALTVNSVIPRNVRVSEAPGFGQTVMTYDPGSRGAVGYLQAAREIAGRAAEVIAGISTTPAASATDKSERSDS